MCESALGHNISVSFYNIFFLNVYFCKNAYCKQPGVTVSTFYCNPGNTRSIRVTLGPVLCQLSMGYMYIWVKSMPILYAFLRVRVFKICVGTLGKDKTLVYFHGSIDGKQKCNGDIL